MILLVNGGYPLGWQGLITDLNNLSDYIKGIASGNWKVDNIFKVQVLLEPLPHCTLFCGSL